MTIAIAAGVTLTLYALFIASLCVLIRRLKRLVGHVAEQPGALADPEPRQLPARPLDADSARSGSDRGGVVFHTKPTGTGA